MCFSFRAVVRPEGLKAEGWPQVEYIEDEAVEGSLNG